MVLHGRTDHDGPPRMGGRGGSPSAEHSQVVGLGPPGGEDHLAGGRPQVCSRLVTGVLHCPAGGAGLGVAPRGVAEGTGEKRPHGLGRLGPDRRGGGVVEVDPVVVVSHQAIHTDFTLQNSCRP